MGYSSNKFIPSIHDFLQQNKQILNRITKITKCDMRMVSASYNFEPYLRMEKKNLYQDYTAQILIRRIDVIGIWS